MNDNAYHMILGRVRGERLNSRVLEEQIQMAVSMGYRMLEVRAYGQHGIGGRLWKAGDEQVDIRVSGQSGQRVGSFGYANTRIEVMGPASDDVGWLNAGAEIVVRGHAANGTGNAMAQGKIYIAGNIGSRGMTMTKQNPRFAPPELWVLGSVGDYFGEFMAGGIAVICGHAPQTPGNVLGHRPLVGMVGGKVFFRGPHDGYSRRDAKQVPLSDADWTWLKENLRAYLERIDRLELLTPLSDREEWQLLVSRSASEKRGRQQRSMSDFRKDVWDRELGEGGLIGDLATYDRSGIPLIVTGELRRFVPVWENRKYLAPCEASCPTGMPVHERWRLVREGRIDEAVDLALSYTPFPATVCGYLCPHPCMSACTRSIGSLASVDVSQIGKASIKAGMPELPPLKEGRIAVIGGGPAGLSVAWQLRRQGYEAVVYDMAETLGGKISAVIPESRIPREVVAAELERAGKVIPYVHLRQELSREEVQQMREDFDYLVVAVGAQKPRTLPIPGGERMLTALDFLGQAKADSVTPGKRVVIIGAGNVGCDVATEASRLGAEDITLLDVQEPASFGKERDEAVAVGAKFRWPCFTKEITDEGVVLRSGEVIPADTVVISIGDQPVLDFLPEDVHIDRGCVVVNDFYQSTDPKIFAIGDAVRPGLITDAIGAGRKAARTISEFLSGMESTLEARQMIDRSRVTLEYFDPRFRTFGDISECGAHCSSCGTCRDCGICVQICPETAIQRADLGEGAYEYAVDDTRCIGCGFCAAACPCGIWNLTENTPLI